MGRNSREGWRRMAVKNHSVMLIGGWALRVLSTQCLAAESCRLSPRLTTLVTVLRGRFYFNVRNVAIFL